MSLAPELASLAKVRCEGASLGTQSHLYVDVRDVDQIPEGDGVGFASGHEFHVTHVLSSAFEQPGGVIKMRTVEETTLVWALNTFT